MHGRRILFHPRYTSLTFSLTGDGNTLGTMGNVLVTPELEPQERCTEVARQPFLHARATHTQTHRAASPEVELPAGLDEAVHDRVARGVVCAHARRVHAIVCGLGPRRLLSALPPLTTLLLLVHRRPKAELVGAVVAVLGVRASDEPQINRGIQVDEWMGLASAQRFRGQPAVGTDVNLRCATHAWRWP